MKLFLFGHKIRFRKRRPIEKKDREGKKKVKRRLGFLRQPQINNRSGKIFLKKIYFLTDRNIIFSIHRKRLQLAIRLPNITQRDIDQPHEGILLELLEVCFL